MSNVLTDFEQIKEALLSIDGEIVRVLVLGQHTTLIEESSPELLKLEIKDKTISIGHKTANTSFTPDRVGFYKLGDKYNLIVEVKR